MARGKEENIVSGQIDPYVQQSMQQNKQLAENRLTTAMQQTGATQRTAMQESGAGQRATLQAKTQRDIEAGRIEQNDKRAAEDEIARRDDRKFSQTMAEASQGFQARQAELNRDQQNAIITGDRKAKDEIEKRRESLRRFNIELGMDANERNTNAMLSILKGSLNRETSMEKAKTVLNNEADQFDKDKDVYSKTIDRVSEAVENDKRMDLTTPAAMKEKIPSTWDVTKGILARPITGGVRSILKTRALKKEIKEGLANPMGVLQDQIDKYGGAISIEDLTSGTINNIEDKIQTEDIRTEDINKTLGVLEGMLNSVDTRRKAVDEDS
ncbi:hypothetical protein LCGC14_2689670, partial [marine sediment metagenome]